MVSNQLKNQHLLWRAGFGPAAERLKHKVDFKDVYATVLSNWLGADDAKILGKEYNKFRFL